MHTLNAAALLATWEEGAGQLPVQRAVMLLASAWPGTSADAWARASIGQRDAQLLTLREELFGIQLEATAVCPGCGEALELAFSTQEIRAAAPAVPDVDEELRLEAGGYQVHYRLPNSTDLLAISQSGAEAGRQSLLERCVRAARHGELTVDAAKLPDEVVSAVMESMAQADPQADVQVALACPACRHRWSVAFDILAYLWSEIEDWAQRLLQEIHVLASGYGWSERDILALSARRRRTYLEMLGA